MKILPKLEKYKDGSQTIYLTKINKQNNKNTQFVWSW